ncbi:MAG: ABC transporter substrate-binding protein [Desulfonatronovibrio sp.]|nr:ABC transporter substrate-binding protein [Desulfovibrionales bacterium]
MKKVFLFFIVCAILMTAATAIGGDIKSVRIGTEGAYPPFNFIDKDGELQGFDVEIARALCEAAEVECEFVVQDWDGMIPGLQAKKYDAIIASMAITEERQEKVAFTDKYYMTPARFVAKKGAGFEVSPEGLKGKTIGVQRATTHENFVRDNFGDTVSIKSYPTQEEANMDLISGRVDLVIADSVVLLEGFVNTEAGQDYEFIGPGFTDEEWYGEGIGIAIRKEDKELVALFNNAIQKIRDNGVYKTINDKYFDFDVYGD